MQCYDDNDTAISNRTVPVNNKYSAVDVIFHQVPTSPSQATCSVKHHDVEVGSQQLSNSSSRRRSSIVSPAHFEQSGSNFPVSQFSKRVKRVQQQRNPRRSNWTTLWKKSSSSITVQVRTSEEQHRSLISLHPTISLPLLVMIDMFAVSLVVPLLFQYYQLAGVNSANQRELLSSIFSMSQIVGGLCMSILSDARVLRRKTMLLISFSGSAISYALIVYGGLHALIISRILVGLVKQTMTVTIAIITKITNKTNRAKHMGRITAASTVAWIVGPSVGALLFKYINKKTPALVACGLFLLNVVLTLLLVQDDNAMENQYYQNRHLFLDKNAERDVPSGIPSSDETNADMLSNDILHISEDDHKDNKSTTVQRRNEVERSDNTLNDCYSEIGDGKTVINNTAKKGLRAMVTNLQSCFSSKVLGTVVVIKLIVTWVGQATNYSALGSFYENMYGLEPHHRGYISSYQQGLQFIVQSFFVDGVLHVTGGERNAVAFFMSLTALAVGLEASRSLLLFLIILCPMISLCFSMVNLALQTLLTHVAPSDTIFSVLAALDVLQNIAHVSVPFYRTALFRFLRPPAEPTNESTAKMKIMMEGDPDPVRWILSSAAHWSIAAAVVAYLLLFSNKKAWDIAEEKHCRNDDVGNINNGTVENKFQSKKGK